MPRMRRSLLVAISLLLAAAAPAAADPFTVSSGADSGPGTLRQAIADSNGNGNGVVDQILFDSPRTVTATAVLPSITSRVRIDGAGGAVHGSGLRVAGGVTQAEVTKLGVAPPGIVLDPGANGKHLGAHRARRVHRTSDGVVRLSGRVGTGGRLDLYTGGGQAFLTNLSGEVAAGNFVVPAPLSEGTVVTATVTNAGRTSQFAQPVTIIDLISPAVDSARTVDRDGDGRVDAIRVTTTEALADSSGFSGLGLVALGAFTADTGPAADDASFDVGITPNPDTAFTPILQVSANSTLADRAANQLLVQSAPIAVADAVAPGIRDATAVSSTQVDLTFSEPLDPASVAAGDFTLQMGERDRRISRLDLDADGRGATLRSSSPWRAGTAGSLTMGGTVSDRAGNATPVGRVSRVFASPGDLVPPRLTGLRLASRNVCVRGVSHVRCPRAGVRVRFRIDEDALITFVVRRHRTKAPSTLRRNVRRGLVNVLLGTIVEGRRLRPGAYRIDVTAADPSGNETHVRHLRFRVLR